MGVEVKRFNRTYLCYHNPPKSIGNRRIDADEIEFYGSL